MTTDPTRCPYGEMEWFCALAPDHDGPHRSDDLSSPGPGLAESVTSPQEGGGGLAEALTGASAWFADLVDDGEGPDLRVNAATKAAHEAREFADAPSLTEAADLLIALQGAADHYGWSHDDLAAAVRAKVEVNRRRYWQQQPDGTWQHVDDEWPCHGCGVTFAGCRTFDNPGGCCAICRHKPDPLPPAGVQVDQEALIQVLASALFERLPCPVCDRIEQCRCRVGRAKREAQRIEHVMAALAPLLDGKDRQ